MEFCNKFRKVIVYSLFFILSSLVFAQNNDFKQGEDLFKENKVEEAIPFLKNAISAGSFPKAYTYLALCYEKLKLYQESLDVCTEAMKVSGTDKKVLAFNAGNVCFAMEDYYSAEKWYSLAIAANRLYAPPVLNRANAELKQEKFVASLEDYKLYLDLSPNDKQKAEIEQIIALLEGYKKAEDERLAEEKRLAEEEALILAAQAKASADEEKAKYAELEAKMAEQQALLDKQNAELERMAQEKKLMEEKEAASSALESRIAEQQALLEQQRSELEKMMQEQRAFQEASLQAQRELAAQKAAEDAERRRKLLEDVAASLQNSETENMSAGAEGTMNYGYQSELE